LSKKLLTKKDIKRIIGEVLAEEYVETPIVESKDLDDLRARGEEFFARINPIFEKVSALLPVVNKVENYYAREDRLPV